MSRTYGVYVLTNVSRTLYVWVTGDVARRLHEHRTADASTFAGRYLTTRLVHVEVAPDARTAVARERQIKGWSRAKKVALIEATNPGWRDLTREVLASLMLG